MKTSNIALSEKRFKGFDHVTDGKIMTIQGTVNKTFILVILACITGGWIWGKHDVAMQTTGDISSVMPYMWTGLAGGFILAMVTIFAQKLSPITAPAYALAEGLALGGVSAMYNAEYEGIVMQSLLITVSILIALLCAYKMRLIRATEQFKSGMMVAMGGILIVYLLDIGLMFFGMRMPFLHESSLIGIGISLVIVAVASGCLILDFDFVENATDAGLPKYMEWYGAFSIMLTLVWLYLEVLKLMAKLKK